MRAIRFVVRETVGWLVVLGLVVVLVLTLDHRFDAIVTAAGHAVMAMTV